MCGLSALSKCAGNRIMNTLACVIYAVQNGSARHGSARLGSANWWRRLVVGNAKAFRFIYGLALNKLRLGGTSLNPVHAACLMPHAACPILQTGRYNLHLS